jgi:hypothetical protein
MEVYAKQAKDAELVELATEIKLRATQRLGEMMDEKAAAGDMAKPPGVKKDRVIEKPDVPTLADQGIDKNLAHAARKLAAMPREKFEAEVKKAKGVAVAAVLGNKGVVKAARAKTRVGSDRATVLVLWSGKKIAGMGYTPRLARVGLL